MRKRTQARECVLKILYQADVAGIPICEALKMFWEAFPCDGEIQSFAERIALGTEKYFQTIDQKIAHYAENWDLKRMAVVDRNILRLAVYELLYMEDIPPKVTINEGVNLAKKFSELEAGKFVNGILDKIHHAEAKGKQEAGDHT